MDSRAILEGSVFRKVCKISLFLGLVVCFLFILN